MKSWWRSVWFAPVGPENLGICRALFFGWLWILCLTWDLSAWGHVASVFHEPLWFFQYWRIPIGSPAELLALQWTWKLTLLTSCVGLFTRFSTVAAWLIGTYLLAVTNSFGKVSHNYQLVVLTMGILAVSPCGDAFSLDAARSMQSRVKRLRRAAGQYRWPVAMVQFFMVLIFFSAGISKVRQSGWEWVASDNLSNILVAAQYGTEETWNSMSLHVARHKPLCMALAGLSLALELAAPLAMLGRRAALVIVGGLFAMQISIYVLMGTSFLMYLGGYLFWIPWSRARR